VTTIVPVVARRTEKHLALAAAKRVERWRRIAREASEQSRRTSPPEIREPLKLAEALTSCHHEPADPGSPASAGFALAGVGLAGEGSASSANNESGCDLCIVLAETEHQSALSEILRAHEDVKSLALAVGPEGGWTADELHLFEQSQWIAASLGDTILRAETAAIAALAVARTEIEIKRANRRSLRSD
jgi:16S rRNA (uracil1498-N3)-methyltransferase